MNTISLRDVLFCWQTNQPVLDIPELVVTEVKGFIRGDQAPEKERHCSAYWVVYCRQIRAQ